MRSEYDRYCEPYWDEEEDAHIKAMKEHRKASKKYKKETCLICQTTETIQCAHIYPVSEFALLIKPGEIPLITLCKLHHGIFDYLATRYLKGWNWKNENYYLDLEPNTKQIIGDLVQAVEDKFFEIMKKHPIDIDPLKFRTGGRWRVIYQKPTE